MMLKFDGQNHNIVTMIIPCRHLDYFNYQVCLFHRPLPSEMVHYAREDTHYLLYICDRLHNELIKHGNANNNLLQSVYSRSRDICLKVCCSVADISCL